MKNMSSSRRKIFWSRLKSEIDIDCHDQLGDLETIMQSLSAMVINDNSIVSYSCVSLSEDDLREQNGFLWAMAPATLAFMGKGSVVVVATHDGMSKPQGIFVFTSSLDHLDWCVKTVLAPLRGYCAMGDVNGFKRKRGGLVETIIPAING